LRLDGIHRFQPLLATGVGPWAKKSCLMNHRGRLHSRCLMHADRLLGEALFLKNWRLPMSSFWSVEMQATVDALRALENLRSGSWRF
jgi:hypothetical protein